MYEPGKQSKQRELQSEDLQQASHCFPATLLRFQMAYRYESCAFSCCMRQFLFVFVCVGLKKERPVFIDPHRKFPLRPISPDPLSVRVDRE